ncbi:MAG: hypothetical protein DME05_25755 [Candidatus Rokuibacteriota bacterium]|nr:MAG: hypothetical protein DME05_25755 [Candidatus Rokubacteria bacterium]
MSHDSSGRSTTSVRSRLPGAPALLTRMDVRDLRDHPSSALADLVRDGLDAAPGARLQRG